MKRNRHDGDYDRVRREAGYAKPKFEFSDEDDEQAKRDRIAKMNAEFKERMAVLDGQDKQRAAEAEARLAARSKEISLRMIAREFEREGVKPPIDGITVSLPLLLKLGWRIGEFDGEKVLVRPASSGNRRKTRADYEAERAGNGEGS